MDLQTTTPPQPSATAVALAFILKQLKKTQEATTEIIENDAAAAQLKAVHDLRVGARRLRVAVGAFRSMLPKKLRHKLDRRFHKLQNAAARVRDLDVWRLELERLQRSRRYQPAVAFALAKAASERQILSQRLKKKCRDRHQQGLWRWARKRIDSELGAAKNAAPQSREAFTSIARERLDKRLKEFEQAFRQAETDAPEDLHQARIAAKKVRYTVEIFRSAYAADAATNAVKSLKALQDSLGSLCDCIVFADLSKRLAEDPDADAQTRASLDLLEHHYQRRVSQKTINFRLYWQHQGKDGPLQTLATLASWTSPHETVFRS